MIRQVLIFSVVVCSASAQTLLRQNYDSRTYNWSRGMGASSLSATGDLSSAGAGRDITLRPCPFGLSTNGKAYISGGTGTAEAVQITGVSGAGGASSCVLTVTTGSAHSGSFTVGSATAGIQEAVNTIPNDNTGGTVVLPSGVLTVYASVNLNRNGVMIHGSSRGGTVLRPGSTNTVFFTSTASGYANYVFSDFQLQGYVLTAANANVGFQFVGLSNVVWERIASNNVWRLFDIDRGNSFTINDIWTWGESNARFIDSTSGASYIRWVNINGWHAFAALSWDSEPVMYSKYAATCSYRNINISLPDTTTRGGMFLDSHQEDISVAHATILGGTYGIKAKDVYFSDYSYLDLDGTGTANMILDGAFQVKISGSNFAAGVGGGGNLLIVENTIPVASGQLTITGNNFGSNGALSVGGGTAIKFDDYIDNVTITGNSFSNLSWKGISQGIEFTDVNSNNLTITGNTFAGEGPGSITTISNANPAVVTTAAPHPYGSGGQTYFEGGTGNWAALNAPGYFQVTVIDSTHFSVPINSTAFGAYGAQSVTYQSASFDIVDPTSSSTSKAFSGNVWLARAPGLFDFHYGELRTRGRFVHVRDLPATGTDTIISHVNGINSTTLFDLVANTAGEYAFRLPANKKVFFDFAGNVGLLVADNYIQPRTVAFASLPAVGPTGAVISVTGATVDSSPCTAGAAVTIAVSDGVSWNCK